MNPVQTIMQFIQGAQQQSPNLNPQQMVGNMLGQNFNTPQDALQAMFQNGKINQQQFQFYSNLMNGGGR